METRELICINCPLGCRMTVTIDQAYRISVIGNTCNRGESYAKNEIMNPLRTVTSTILVQQGESLLVSCKTKSEIPKGKIMDCMQEINNAVVVAPVYIGDVLIENVAGTGVNVVATKDVLKSTSE